MELRNCPECGKVFTYIRTNLCPACQQKDEEDFKTVRKFIAQHPGCDLVMVSEGTGVSEAKIIRYLREGRITANNTAGTNIKINCEVCGTLISSGRFCKDCSEKLVSGLKKSIQEENKKILEEMEKKKTGVRMHTADFWKDRR